MRERKRRTRTGCLTCRVRRVKCDERIPSCERCQSANVSCAGYEQRREIVPRAPVRVAATLTTRSLSYGSHTGSQKSPTSARADNESSIERRAAASLLPLQALPKGACNSPLISIPSNPRADQRPGTGARHVLGYHQILLRTLPLLFPSNHLWFWRDELCQEAWGQEYIYLILVALGSLHRAVLLGSVPETVGNGLDVKVTAVHTYTSAMKELAENLEEAKLSPRRLVGVLCLMAYFETFSGNIPGCIGRVQAAEHYFANLVSHIPFDRRNDDDDDSLEPLRDCLRSLGRMCFIALPTPSLRVASRELISSPSQGLGEFPLNATSPIVFRDLTNLVFSEPNIPEIIWDPLKPYARVVSVLELHRFEKSLRTWRDHYQPLIPALDSDSAIETFLTYKWGKFLIPPPSHAPLAACAGVVAAHYNFYLARVKWALCLLGQDAERSRTSAEFYFYEALRFVVLLVAEFPPSKSVPANTYIPCESVTSGILGLLYITAQCSPQPTWLIWIGELCQRIEQEGLVKGQSLASNLNCLHSFEAWKAGLSPLPLTASTLAPLEHYPAPADRVICQLIPEVDGRHFVSYFARPLLGDPNTRDAESHQGAGDHSRLQAYQVIGHARWRCYFGEHPCSPELTVYDEVRIQSETLSREWLLNKQACKEWLAWSTHAEFDIDRALSDHISGTRLLPAPDEYQAFWTTL